MALVPFGYGGFSSNQFNSLNYMQNQYYNGGFANPGAYFGSNYSGQSWYQPSYNPTDGSSRADRQGSLGEQFLNLLNQFDDRYQYEQNLRNSARNQGLPPYGVPGGMNYSPGQVYQYIKETKYVPYPVFLNQGARNFGIPRNFGYPSYPPNIGYPSFPNYNLGQGGNMNLFPKNRVIFIPTGQSSFQQPWTGPLTMPPFLYNRMAQPFYSFPLPPPLPQIGSLPLTPAVQQMVMERYSNPVAVLPYSSSWQMPQLMMPDYFQAFQQQQQPMMPMPAYPSYPFAPQPYIPPPMPACPSYPFAPQPYIPPPTPACPSYPFAPQPYALPPPPQPYPLPPPPQPYALPPPPQPYLLPPPPPQPYALPPAPQPYPLPPPPQPYALPPPPQPYLLPPPPPQPYALPPAPQPYPLPPPPQPYALPPAPQPCIAPPAPIPASPAVPPAPQSYNFPPPTIPANLPMLPLPPLPPPPPPPSLSQLSLPSVSPVSPVVPQYSNSGYPSTCRACPPAPPPLNIPVTGHCWVQHCAACHHVPTPVSHPNARPYGGRATPLLRYPTVPQYIPDQTSQQQHLHNNAPVMMRPWLRKTPPLPPGAILISDEYIEKNDSQPQQYNAQPQQYSAQPQQYNAQPQQYNAQPQQYSAQPQQYSAQPQQYNAQPQQYSAQLQQYSAQPQLYNPHSQYYDSQKQRSRHYQPSSRVKNRSTTVTTRIIPSTHSTAKQNNRSISPRRTNRNNINSAQYQGVIKSKNTASSRSTTTSSSGLSVEYRKTMMSSPKIKQIAIPTQLASETRNVNGQLKYQSQDVPAVYLINRFLQSSSDGSTFSSNHKLPLDDSSSIAKENSRTSLSSNDSNFTKIKLNSEKKDEKRIRPPSRSEKPKQKIIIIRQFMTDSPSSISTTSSSSPFSILDENMDSVSTTSTIKAKKSKPSDALRHEKF